MILNTIRFSGTKIGSLDQKLCSVATAAFTLCLFASLRTERQSKRCRKPKEASHRTLGAKLEKWGKSQEKRANAAHTKLFALKEALVCRAVFFESCCHTENATNSTFQLSFTMYCGTRNASEAQKRLPNIIFGTPSFSDVAGDKPAHLIYICPGYQSG